MSANRCVIIVLMAIVMALIFWFSAKTAVVSNEQSTNVTKIIAEAVIPHYKQMSEKERYEVVKALNGIIRKAAHACIYAVLGALSMALVLTYPMIRGRKIKQWQRLLMAVLFCAAYASLDEFHQLFVPGRGGQISDVLIDTLGASIGAMIVATISFVLKRRI